MHIHTLDLSPLHSHPMFVKLEAKLISSFSDDGVSVLRGVGVVRCAGVVGDVGFEYR